MAGCAMSGTIAVASSCNTITCSTLAKHRLVFGNCTNVVHQIRYSECQRSASAVCGVHELLDTGSATETARAAATHGTGAKPELGGEGGGCRSGALEKALLASKSGSQAVGSEAYGLAGRSSRM